MTTDKELRAQQRIVGTEIALLLSQLTLNHKIPFDEAVRMASHALHKSYWGTYPDGVQQSREQRITALELGVTIADLVIHHGIEDEERLHNMCSKALYRSYWGVLPESKTGPIVPVP